MTDEKRADEPTDDTPEEAVIPQAGAAAGLQGIRQAWHDFRDRWRTPAGNAKG
jgi:hypothetical protein